MSLARVLTLTMGLSVPMACATAPPQTPMASLQPFIGGTLRIVTPSDASIFGGFSDPESNTYALDPHRDWPAPDDTGELMRCCLARNLLSTNGRATDQGGSRLHPDAAESLPEISADGLTWTFHLKHGLRYAPPLQDVEITAPDFIRSFHRFLAPGYDEDYSPTLYMDIVGAAEYRAGDATSISGFESPDPYTLRIRLTKPAGDLAPRLAAAGAIPIPASLTNPGAQFGVADGHDDGYGRFLASSGPYMIEGAGDIDFTKPPAEQKPVSGLVQGESIALVPNPSWDASTDSLRVARPSRIEFRVVPSFEDAVAAINAGAADLLVNSDAGIPDDVLAAINENPTLGKLFISENGTAMGLTINTAHPPFDDIHVRRALNHVVDKGNIIDALGGSLHRRVAYHVAPDSMEDNLLLEYRPYGEAPNLELAMAEMAQSAYDTDHDGVCDAPECSEVPIAVGDEVFAALVAEDLDAIGIQLNLDETVAPFEAISDPSVKAALFLPHGWGRDYLSASNFFVGQFYSPVALPPDGVANASLVGASAEQLAGWGYGNVEVPNVDSRIEACIPLTGAAQFECWAALDQYMMENVVSSVPCNSGVITILASSRVISYSWDELATAPAYDRIETTPD